MAIVLNRSTRKGPFHHQSMRSAAYAVAGNGRVAMQILLDAPPYTKHAAADAAKASAVNEGVLQNRNNLRLRRSRASVAELLDYRGQPGDGLRGNRIEHDLDVADAGGMERSKRIGDLFR